MRAKPVRCPGACCAGTPVKQEILERKVNTGEPCEGDCRLGPTAALPGVPATGPSRPALEAAVLLSGQPCAPRPPQSAAPWCRVLRVIACTAHTHLGLSAHHSAPGGWQHLCWGFLPVSGRGHPGGQGAAAGTASHHQDLMSLSFLPQSGGHGTSPRAGRETGLPASGACPRRPRLGSRGPPRATVSQGHGHSAHCQGWAPYPHPPGACRWPPSSAARGGPCCGFAPWSPVVVGLGKERAAPSLCSHTAGDPAPFSVSSLPGRPAFTPCGGC